MLLRSFGATIGKRCIVHASARIWAPWNLAMEDDSCLGQYVDCYCVDRITIGARAVVSQYAFLCTASHSIDDIAMPLVTAPVALEAESWVAARAYVGPGVSIGRGAVVGACAVVTRSVDAMKVVAGNPAREIGVRKFRSGDPPAGNAWPQ